MSLFAMASGFVLRVCRASPGHSSGLRSGQFCQRQNDPAAPSVCPASGQPVKTTPRGPIGKPSMAGASTSTGGRSLHIVGTSGCLSSPERHLPPGGPSPGDPSLETFHARDDCDTIHKSSPARPWPGGAASPFNWPWFLGQMQMT